MNKKKWLKNRDIKAKKAAKEVEGGTMEPLLFTVRCCKLFCPL